MKHLIRHAKKELNNNLFMYLTLFTVGVFYLISLSLNKGNKSLNFLMLVFFSLFYIAWGILHHAAEKTLHFKTVLEYILIGFTIIFLLKILF